MTGSRARRLLREEMERRYYRLRQFLACYLHEDWPEFYGSPQRAIDVAIAEYPIELRQQVRKELATLLDEAPDDVELREKLNNGLGVCVYFKEPGEARAFALDAEERLMTSIKKHFRPGDEGVGQ